MSNLEYLNNTGNSLVQKAPTEEKVAKLEANLKMLNSRWNDISTAVDERVDKLETAIEQLRQYQVGRSLGCRVFEMVSGREVTWV